MSSIAKVAARAGVSATTVSHAINHPERISKALLARVQAAIEELGYEPNPQAQSLRTGRTNLIAMLIPDIDNQYHPEMVKVAQAELAQAGLDLLIFNTDVPGGHSTAHGREILRQIARKRVDGIIVAAPALHGIHDALPTLHAPAVFIGGAPRDDADSVMLDEFDGARQMAAYLAGKGHRRVASITGPSFLEETIALIDGFAEGFTAAGGALDDILRFEGTFLEPSGADAVRWLLAMPAEERPTAVFFGNYLMALGALAELHDQNLRIPDDMAVAVSDDLRRMTYVRPTLTRVGNSPAELARRAVELLLERLRGRFDGPPRTEVISCHLRGGESA